MNRNESRKVIMTILYQVFMYDNSKIQYELDDVINENLSVDNDFVKEVVNGVIANKKEIEKKANNYLKDWKLERLGLTDQAILCMGIYELIYTDTPDIVAINEALELAKIYSDEKVKNMINGVLDKIYHEKID